jgi:hypothetical protein
MVNKETDKGKRAAFSARMSVEAIVVALVASATVGILTAQILAGGREDSGSPVPTKAAGLRHDAVSMAPPSDTSQNIATDTAAAAQDKSSQRSAPLRDGDRASLPNVQHLSGADLEAREVSGGGRALTNPPSNDTVVRNGITIVSPPLLVPVISADAIQTPNGSEVLTSPRKAPSARKRSHYTNRNHRHGQRRVVRSAPFWRIVAR